MSTFYAIAYRGKMPPRYERELTYRGEIKVFESCEAMEEFLYRSVLEHLRIDSPISALILPGRWAYGCWLQRNAMQKELLWEPPPPPFTSWEQLEIREEMHVGGMVGPTCFITPKRPIYIITDVRVNLDIRIQLASEHQTEKDRVEQLLSKGRGA